MVILGISPLTSFILTLTVVLVAKLVISGILSPIFFILALYTSILTTTFFTTLLGLPKSAGVVSNFPISNTSTLLFKLLNHLAHLLFHQYLICLHQILN